MLGGSIDVRSEIGKGTEVRVTLPMIRGQRFETPVSTPGSTTTLERQQDDSITMLRERANETKIALYGFKTDHQDNSPSPGISVNIQVEKSLSTYITDWYGIAVTAPSDSLSSADIIIVDEEHLDAFRAAYSTSITKPAAPAVICLCSNSTRHGQSSSWQGDGCFLECVSKPFGPYKLARALRSCLNKLNNPLQGAETAQVGINHTDQSSGLGIEVVLSKHEDMAIETDFDKTPINIVNDGQVPANGENTNAQVAVDMDTTDGKLNPEPLADYPFPHMDNPLPSENMSSRGTEEGSISRRRTVPLFPQTDANHTSAVSRRGETASSSESSHESNGSENRSSQEKQPPRILLVDDNKINLRLLQTYMRKRHYSLVASADDGGEAVRAFRQSDGYDIIFMGILPPLTFLWCQSLILY